MAMSPQIRILKNLRLLQILALLVPQGFIITLNGIAAPWMLKDFNLSASQLARVFACIAISGVGALLLTRLFDVVGRGRVLSWSLFVSAAGAIGAALSRTVLPFALFEIALLAATGAIVAGAPVVIAEVLAAPERAAGQAWGGIALGAGAGACMFAMPILLRLGLSWRFLLWLAALPIVAVPWMLTESWQSQFWLPIEHGSVMPRESAASLIRPPHRQRALTFMISNIFSSVAIATAKSWSYFHCVSNVGLTPGVSSAILILSGGIALAGFPIGASLCERIGRVGTVAIFATLVALSLAFSFWGPPRNYIHSFLWLLAGFSVFGLAMNATTVGGTTAATELFPTGMRATAAGAIAIAGTVGRVAGQSLVALLAARIGGVSFVVGLLGLSAIGTSILFIAFVDESRGLALESATAAI
ncbi:MAG TPA: MFS transporter [Candidatus Binataceae bacterium]|nr:MFS transporter [Candidatus Binataceae bacterium]